MRNASFEIARAVLMLVAFVSMTAAEAKVYKCVIEGKTNFQDQPCQNEPAVAPAAAAPVTDLPTAGSEAFFNEANKPPYRPAVSADLATATPRDYFMRSVKACEGKNEGDFFAEFSYPIRRGFSRKSPSMRSQMFELYCQQMTAASVAKLLSERKFSIMQSAAPEQGVRKSVLCWRPKEAPGNPCQNMMDVVIENGQLKRDQF